MVKLFPSARDVALRLALAIASITAACGGSGSGGTPPAPASTSTSTSTAADTTAPTISITGPSSSGSYTAITASITLSGSAGDNIGVQQVSWSNSMGGTGSASITGTTTATWTSSAIALQSGTNTLTVTARDAAGNTKASTLVVTYNASASTAAYYISTAGNDANTCTAAQSAATPKKTFASAWGCLGAGATLIVADGSYAAASPPTGKTGTSGSPVIIRAANDGGAVLTGGLVLKNNQYLEFEGFNVTGSLIALDASSNGAGLVTHHVTFRRTGFTCTASGTTLNDGACISLYDGTHHMLLEDFWVSGSGRYNVMAYGGPGGSPANTTADNNTFRRGVIRQGPTKSSGGNPQAGIAMYYASNNVIENVIVLDGVPASDTSNSAFYNTAHNTPPNVAGNKYYGVIALNNLGVGFYLDADNGANASNTEIRNSAFWGSASDGMDFYINGTCTGTIVDHVTSGAHGGNGLWNYCTNTSVRSSIFVNNGQYGMSQGGQGSASSNYNDFFGNASGARQNLAAGAADIAASPLLSYLLRTEPGTVCKGAGEGGTNCGANIVNRYQDGVETPQPLWPWPNQNRIKAAMCTGADASRGFCAKSSLTEYIWTYLGSPSPY